MFDVETSGNMMVDVPNRGRVACLCRLEITKTNDRHQAWFTLEIRTILGVGVTTTAEEENKVVEVLLQRAMKAIASVPKPYHGKEVPDVRDQEDSEDGSVGQG